MALNRLLQDHLFPALAQFTSRWQTTRFALIIISFMIVIVLTFFTLLAILDWLFFSLSLGEYDYTAGLATLVSLMLWWPVYGWGRDLIDSIFFPDTAGFQARVIEACRGLADIDTPAKLAHFITRYLPAQLQVDYLEIRERPETEDKAIALPLTMGGRSLGVLVIGPKCSGRSFNQEELAGLRQLQEQVSLVLSVMQLEEARQRAERTDSLKNNFLTNISHELRTPLNTVINSTGLVVDGLLGPINGTQVEYLGRAVDGSEYLLSLLNDILDITKIETGVLTLQLRMLDLREVIDDVLPMVRAMLRGKPVELGANIAENIPIVMADRLRFRQILLNLLSNAAKFTREGWISVRVWSEANQVLISVEDSGIGIAAEDLPLIFQDYQQILTRPNRSMPSERRRHFGTGLGMPITRALVELHGGKIQVESSLGQGSTFTLSLPGL
jgi:signal transduction histidine kinase